MVLPLDISLCQNVISGELVEAGNGESLCLDWWEMLK